MAQPGLFLDDRYRLGERIAAGGMGEVWRATDVLLNRQVAVKLMRPHYAQDGEGLARFRAEARYAASLQHPNIAVVYDYWEGDPPGQPYLVMELVNGPSLAGVVEQGAMPPGPAMDVVAQTAAGLQAAHAAGLVHRDVKPGNLLIAPGGQVKITDFGIARARSSAALTSTGMVVGTMAYLAPERLHGAPATPAADLYALGMVAHECLTGKRPFDGEPMAIAYAHQRGQLPPLPPSVPPEVAGLVARLAAKDPRDRPASAGEVAERAGRLRAVLTGSAASYQDASAYPGSAPAAAGGSASGDYLPTQSSRAGTWPGQARTAGGPASGGVTAADLPPPGKRFRLRAVLLAGGLAAAAVVAVLVMVLPGSPPRHGSARLRSAQRSLAATTPAATPATGTVSAAVPQQPAPTAAPVASPAWTPAPAASPAATVTPATSATAPTPPGTPTPASAPTGTASP